MPATPTQLLTFAEFERLPDPREGYYELHHGELTLLAPPKHLHYRLQTRMQRLLQSSAGDAWVVGTEMPFRPQPDCEFWYADIAVIAADRFEATDAQGNIHGVPELVIEVLSPSNTAAEMLDRRDICLHNGAREFWVVNPAHNLVEVYTPDGRYLSYRAGQQVPLFCGGSLAMDAIFR